MSTAAASKKKTSVKKPMPSKKGAAKRQRSAKKAKSTKGEKEYEVYSIIGHKEVQGVHYWLVTWKGCDEKENQWLPIWSGLDKLDVFKEYLKDKMSDKGEVNINNRW